jgi:hypothetical protein
MHLTRSANRIWLIARLNRQRARAESNDVRVYLHLTTVASRASRDDAYVSDYVVRLHTFVVRAPV